MVEEPHLGQRNKSRRISGAISRYMPGQVSFEFLQIMCSSSDLVGQLDLAKGWGYPFDRGAIIIKLARKCGVFVFLFGVQPVWLRRNLKSFKKRLSALG